MDQEDNKGNYPIYILSEEDTFGIDFGANGKACCLIQTKEFIN